ncbi:hypothetical protein [Neglectibacter caecimuris]|uniref:hypothetical protein n=1 Tax=Neglectibacter caecimuris TaxID=3093658 RepID=UPI002AC95FF3|nr:hypothetical protein [Neglectibacter sp. M00184]
MINLKEKVNLMGKKVKIVCTDGQIVVGIFSEIFDKEDNEWREGEELPTSESILIDTKDYPMELFIEEILSITAI